MKSFNPSFFAVENFLQRKETFDCLPEQARDVCHIAFNVNDAYVKMAGVTCISVLENNKDMYFTFHILPMGVPMKIWKEYVKWRNNGNAAASCISCI